MLALVVTALLFYLVVPVRAYVTQRQRLDDLQRQTQLLQQQNAKLERQVAPGHGQEGGDRLHRRAEERSSPARRLLVDSRPLGASPGPPLGRLLWRPMDLQRTLRKIDDSQQRRPWLAFPFAVFKKFGDDQAGNLAALIAYYGFFSMFPLLLTFVSVLGLVLRGHKGLQDSIVHSALRDFPVIGDQIAKNVHSLSGNGVALAVGIAGTLWAGMARGAPSRRYRPRRGPTYQPPTRPTIPPSACTPVDPA